MQDISPEAPERRRGASGRGHGERPWAIVKRVALGVYADGFIHAGNLAYMALVSLFPFFIVTAALAHVLGRGPDTAVAVESFLRTLPKAVAVLLRQPIDDVLAARTGLLLWLGGLVGLWTTGSFIETVRDILRRAYGTQYSRAFWHYRLGAVALIVGAVVLLLTAFTAQVALTAVEQFVYRLFPEAHHVLGWIGWSKAAPAVALFVSLYLIFFSLTPARYRYSACPKWPGALLTAVWWVVVTAALPWVLARLGGYDRTYGGLAGTIVALFFFWLVGFGLVVGAHLNAALAEPPDASLKSAAEER